MDDSRTLLIVDDDKSVLELLESSLVRFGYSVRKAADGLQAVASVGEQTPDLVIMDVSMPKMDGLQACKEIKELEQDGFIPVILLTGKGTTTDKLRGLDSGADDYLTKPFIISELIARVKSMLRIKKLTEQLQKTRSELIIAKQTAAIAATAVTLNDKINTPLTRILVNIEIMDRKMPDRVRETCSRHLRDTVDAANKIGELTKKLARLPQPSMVEYLKGTTMVDLDAQD
jgi:DNA-binding response OmpR family regulator